ncbi:MAG: tetratricopeptide repeat protein, partial [Cyanobacteria bacterium J06649_11]
QNIEHRVPPQRWLEWLQHFGNKVLASLAPNYELASRMVELGELEIGEIGDAAYDIGVQLLTRNSKQQPVYSIPISTESEGLTPASPVSEELIIKPVGVDTENESYNFQPNEALIESVAVDGEFDIAESFAESPGQELIKEFGELLWEDYEPQTEAVTPVNKNLSIPGEEFSDALYEQVFEYEEESVRSENDNSTALEEEVRDSLYEQVFESEEQFEQEQLEEEIIRSVNPDSQTSEELPRSVKEQVFDYEEQLEEEPAEQPTILPPSQAITPGQDLVRNLGELLWDDQTEQFPQQSPSNDSEQEFISNLSDLVWEYPSQNTDETIFVPTPEYIGEQEEPINTSFVPIQDSAEDSVEDEESLENFNALLELASEVEDEEEQQETEVLETEVLEKAVTNPQATEAKSADELLARLDESTSLVRSLSSGLGYQQSSSLVVNGIPIDNETVAQQAEAWYYQGLAQARAGNLESAVELYEKAVQTKPDVHEYWFNRGLTLFHLGNLEGAIAS